MTSIIKGKSSLMLHSVSKTRKNTIMCIPILWWFSMFSCSELVVSFKIDIQSCTNYEGISGFCRKQEECIYTRNATSSECQYPLICCPKPTISEKKCFEYSAAAYRSSGGAFNLMGNPDESAKSDECTINAVPLIVGGEKVVLKEFPHMAAIGFGNNPYKAKWMCGGSLISERHILTAAHCLDNSNAGRPRFIKLGITNVIDDYNKTNMQLFEIEDIIFHPRFMKREKINDIALLKLSKAARLTQFVRPACLDYSGVLKERKAIATGWGKLKHEDTGSSKNLMKVQLDIIGKPDCTKSFKYKYRNGLKDSLLCAGVITGGKDTCQGDSGGPLQTIKQDPYCMYNLIGVTSFGLICGAQWAPAIYSRVFTYVPWIESIVWPQHS